MENIQTILFLLLAVGLFLAIMVLLRLYVILQIAEKIFKLVHRRVNETDLVLERTLGSAKGVFQTILRLILILIGRDKKS